MCSVILRGCSISLYRPFDHQVDPLELYIPDKATVRTAIECVKAGEWEGWTIPELVTWHFEGWTAKETGDEWSFLRLPRKARVSDRDGSSGTEPIVLQPLELADALEPGCRYLLLPPDAPLIDITISSSSSSSSSPSIKLSLPICSETTARTLCHQLARLLDIHIAPVTEQASANLGPGRSPDAEGSDLWTVTCGPESRSAVIDMDRPLIDLAGIDTTGAFELQIVLNQATDIHGESAACVPPDTAYNTENEHNITLKTRRVPVSATRDGVQLPGEERTPGPSGTSGTPHRAKHRVRRSRPPHHKGIAAGLVTRASPSTSMSLPPSTSIEAALRSDVSIPTGDIEAGEIRRSSEATSIDHEFNIIPSLSPLSPDSFTSPSSSTSLGLAHYPLQAETTGAATTGPSITGGRWMKRLGLASIAAWSTTSEADERKDDASNDVFPGAAPSGFHGEPSRLRGSISRGLWSWWSGESESSGEENSAAAYLDRLKRIRGKSLLQELVGLRVQLSTARLSFLVDLVDLGGINALDGYLSAASLSQSDDPTNTQTIGEIIKCLRLIMNTEGGFEAGTIHSTLVPNICNVLTTSKLKTRTLAGQTIAGVCVVSPFVAQTTVIPALSDLRVSIDERYRFEWLIDSLQWEYVAEKATDENELWDWREALLGLVEAAIHSFDDLEGRCAMRAELRRRKLNLALEALCDREPPASFLTQVEAYREGEKADLDEFKGFNVTTLIESSKLASDVMSAKTVLETELSLADVERQHVFGVIAQNNELKAELDTTRTQLERATKDNDYLNRCLDIVHSRVSRMEDSDGKQPRKTPVDAHIIATQVVVRLVEQEEQMALMRKQIEELKSIPNQNARPVRKKERVGTGQDLLPGLSLEIDRCSDIPTPPPPPTPPTPPSAPLFAVNLDSSAQSTSPAPPPPPVLTSSGGPPPPPPPLPPLGLSKTMGGANGRPSSQTKLKPFFWTKLGIAAIRETIWEEIKSSIQIRDNFADLARVFSVEEVHKNSRPAESQPKQTSLLDITRSNNVSILLVRLRMKPRQVKMSLLQADEDVLSVDELDALSRLVPTSEEIDRLKSYSGPVNMLGKAEQYFLEISDIPDLKLRFEAMIFVRRFPLLLTEVMPELEILHRAVLQVRSSERLRLVLSMVLDLGNAMNAGTFRGSALGFKLEDLSKLGEVKTARCPYPTMLHYLAASILQAQPDLATFHEDVPALSTAAHLAPSDLYSCVTGIERSFQAVGKFAQKTPHAPDDQLPSTVQAFLETAREEIVQLKARTKDLQSELSALVAYFGDKDLKPETLFGALLDFALALEKAAADMALDLDPRANAAADLPLLKEQPTGESFLSQMSDLVDRHSRLASAQTIKTVRSNLATTIKPTFRRGDLDAAIQSVRMGGSVLRHHERERSAVKRQSGGTVRTTKLSRIFLDQVTNVDRRAQALPRG